MTSPYPPVRRLITGHNLDDGQAIHIRDEKFKTNAGRDGQVSLPKKV